MVLKAVDPVIKQNLDKISPPKLIIFTTRTTRNQIHEKNILIFLALISLNLKEKSMIDLDVQKHDM